MAAPRKTLRKLVADRSFLARRHANLLVDEELVDDVALRTLQVSYRLETDGLERQTLARRFEKAVQQLDRGPVLTMDQTLLATIGPKSADAALQARWDRWDKRDGYAWRVRFDAMTHQDVAKACRRLDIHEPGPDLLERARSVLPKKKPANPPGWSHVQ